MDRTIAVFCFLMSCYWVYGGWALYGFWENNGPGGGFLPVIAGLATAALSLYVLVKKLSAAPVKLEIKGFLPAAAVFAALLLMSVLGMLATIFVFVLCWLKFVARYSLPRSLAIAGVMTVFIFLVFGLWLDVPLPAGMIGV